MPLPVARETRKGEGEGSMQVAVAADEGEGEDGTCLVVGFNQIRLLPATGLKLFLYQPVLL